MHRRQQFVREMEFFLKIYMEILSDDYGTEELTCNQIKEPPTFDFPKWGILQSYSLAAVMQGSFSMPQLQISIIDLSGP